MVRTRLPEHIAAAHALEAAENILQRVVERVAHMERARHIRWRDDNRVGFRGFALGTAGFECAFLLPHIANACFHCCRIEPIVHHEKIIPAGIGPKALNEGARKRSISALSTWRSRIWNAPSALAGNLLDFRLNEALDNARQMSIKPLSQNRLKCRFNQRPQNRVRRFGFRLMRCDRCLP